MSFKKTVTTTKIISLTITHSESEAAVEYTLIDGAEQSTEPIAHDDCRKPR